MKRAEIIEKAVSNMVSYASEGDQTTWDNIISLWQLSLFIIAIRFGFQKDIPDPLATGPWYADDDPDYPWLDNPGREWAGHPWLPIYCTY